MNMIDAVRKLRGKRWGQSKELVFDLMLPEEARVQVAQQLDELTGHSKAVEACRAVVFIISAMKDSPCGLCGGERTHAERCAFRLCEAAVADAEK